MEVQGTRDSVKLGQISERTLMRLQTKRVGSFQIKVYRRSEIPINFPVVLFHGSWQNVT